MSKEGSYVRDPKTKKLKRVEEPTAPRNAGQAAEPVTASPPAAESKE